MAPHREMCNQINSYLIECVTGLYDCLKQYLQPRKKCPACLRAL